MPGKDIYVQKPGQATFPKYPSRYGKWMWIKGALDIFSAENEADHAQLRRLLIPAFSDIAIGELEALVQKNVDILVRKRVTDSAVKGRVDMSA